MRIPLTAEHGLKIRAGDGGAEHGHAEMMGTTRFYSAEAGDKLIPLTTGYKFAVATYRPCVEDKLIYTYDYAPEEAWVAYNGDLSGESYRQCEYIFAEDTYFRISLRRIDGAPFSEKEDIADILAFEQSDTLRFALLTDTHYTINGTWNATAGEIWAANRRRALDGIIHLGDFTDGMVSKALCEEYANIILSDLKAVGAPVWAALGNHDTNYFKNNPQPMTLEEQCKLYLGREEPRYTVDFEAHKLRLFFLDSYHPDSGELRYGYSPECISWLKNALAAMPQDWSAIVFSHVPPFARLQVWVDKIQGEAALSAVFNAYSDKILAFIHGHVHADILCNDAIPVVAIGCAKCECELVYKIQGAYTPERVLDTASQGLWDILSVDTANKRLTFRRQGAGKNRMIQNGKAEWL